MIYELSLVFYDRYQVWAFQYHTGQSFQRSAADLRRELQAIRQRLDPAASDPAMSNMVLVGHSMGGLVSKLQIVDSGNQLWSSLTSQPFHEIVASPVDVKLLDEMFFFEPVPSVKRVVFIGTPHQGSPFADSLVGKLGSRLVATPRASVELVASLIKNNPMMFPESLSRHVPTSVDMLRPDSALLTSMFKLPVPPDVSLHTIIGTAGKLPDGSPGDGVVAVASAQHPRTVSEEFVEARHTELLKSPDTVEELVRILVDHALEVAPPAPYLAGRDSSSSHY